VPAQRVKTSVTTGAIARSALPRWLIASFSDTLSSAVDTS